MNVYTCSGLLANVLKTLLDDGKDPARLEPADLEQFGAFHVRGREASQELATLAGLCAAADVLDVGCGIGASARYLAVGWGCQVHGIDLSAEYIETASELTRRCGLNTCTCFQVASALALPFADSRFDYVWSEHVQMNIADKTGFYTEAARVLKSGGRMVMYEVLAGSDGELQYPVPWAASASESYLIPVEELRALLLQAGLRPVVTHDVSAASLQWFTGQAALPAAARKSTGLHLLMGGDAALKVRNLQENLTAGRVSIWQIIAVKQD